MEKQEFIFPVKKIAVIIVLLGVFILAYSLPFIKALIDVYNNKKVDIDVMYFVLSAFIFYGVMFLLWLIKGTEKLVFTNDYMEITKSNTIITLSKKYYYKNITEIEIRENTYQINPKIDSKLEAIVEKRRAFPFWINMGKIKFKYKGRSINIISEIKEYDALEIIKTLKQLVSKK